MRLTSNSQQLEKAEREKYELQRRLKAAESGGAYAAQKVRLLIFTITYHQFWTMVYYLSHLKHDIIVSCCFTAFSM